MSYITNIDENGMQLIEKAKQAIALPKNYDGRDEIIEAAMNAMYDYFSTYSEESLCSYSFQKEIFEVEKMLNNEYLPINTVPIYDENNNNVPNNESELLDFVIHCTRKKLSERRNLERDSLNGYCPTTSRYLEKVCSELGLETIHIGVNRDLFVGSFHEFTIVRIKSDDGTYKNYLADCTYRQFFTKKDSNQRRIGVTRGPARGCSIGSYMMMNDRRKEIAETILTKGYIELTPEVFKEYFDAIIYSGRDANYYKGKGLNYMNPDDVIPKNSVSDYLKILRCTDVISKSDFSILSSELGYEKSKKISLFK